MGLGNLISTIMSLTLRLLTGRESPFLPAFSPEQTFVIPSRTNPSPARAFLVGKGEVSFLGADEPGRQGCRERVPQCGSPLRPTQSAQSARRIRA